MVYVVRLSPAIDVLTFDVGHGASQELRMYDIGGTRNSVSALIPSMIGLTYLVMISALRGRRTSMMVRSQAMIF